MAFLKQTSIIFLIEDLAPLVDPDDFDVMKQLQAGDYSQMGTLKFYFVILTTGYTHDLNVDGLWGPDDFGLIKDMLQGSDSRHAPGMPDSLEMSEPPLTMLQVGPTTRIGVKAKTQELGKYTTGAASLVQSQVQELPQAALEPGVDLPKRLGLRELAEQHGHELVPAGKAF